MKVSGFTFVRNGIKFDYPFRESILSALPLVDEMIVNVPESDDDTLKAVKDICDPKIKIFETKWGGDIPTGGKILLGVRDNGVIKISATLIGTHVSFVISDNGLGMPESVDFENSNGFGLQMVSMLTKDLKGTIKIERCKGTKVTLEFDM